MACMSYCCIENTTDEMAQVLYKFETQQKELHSQPYEMASIERLYRQCKEYVEEYESYLKDEEQYIEDHCINDDDDDNDDEEYED